MLDENEFLSPYGIRSLSRYHADHSDVINAGGLEYRVAYLPAESNSWNGLIARIINLFASIKLECILKAGTKALYGRQVMQLGLPDGFSPELVRSVARDDIPHPELDGRAEIGSNGSGSRSSRGALP